MKLPGDSAGRSTRRSNARGALIQQIDRSLAALPLPVKTAFLLSRSDGLSYPEIAKQLGVSQPTWERHMPRALLQCLRCAP